MLAEADGRENGRWLECPLTILGFHITMKKPSVTALPIHLSQNQGRRHQYLRRDGSGSKLSLLDCYFLHPPGVFHMEGATHSFESLTYREYYAYF